MMQSLQGGTNLTLLLHLQDNAVIADLEASTALYSRLMDDNSYIQRLRLALSVDDIASLESLHALIARAIRPGNLRHLLILYNVVIHPVGIIELLHALSRLAV